MLRNRVKKVKNRKGFTLIELIVVVAILGVLAAIAVPSYQGYLDGARINTNKANMATVQNAVWVYQAANAKLPADEAALKDAKYLGKAAPVPIITTDTESAYAAATGQTFIMDDESGVVSIGTAEDGKTTAISGAAVESK